jgi:hypothetical protein
VAGLLDLATLAAVKRRHVDQAESRQHDFSRLDAKALHHLVNKSWLTLGFLLGRAYSSLLKELRKSLTGSLCIGLELNQNPLWVISGHGGRTSVFPLSS